MKLWRWCNDNNQQVALRHFSNQPTRVTVSANKSEAQIESTNDNQKKAGSSRFQAAGEGPSRDPLCALTARLRFKL